MNRSEINKTLKPLPDLVAAPRQRAALLKVPGSTAHALNHEDCRARTRTKPQPASKGGQLPPWTAATCRAVSSPNMPSAQRVFAFSAPLRFAPISAFAFFFGRLDVGRLELSWKLAVSPFVPFHLFSNGVTKRDKRCQKVTKSDIATLLSCGADMLVCGFPTPRHVAEFPAQTCSLLSASLRSLRLRYWILELLWMLEAWILELLFCRPPTSGSEPRPTQSPFTTPRGQKSHATHSVQLMKLKILQVVKNGKLRKNTEKHGKLRKRTVNPLNQTDEPIQA